MAQDAGLIDTKSSSSMLVVRGGRVYSPADLGIRTVVGNSTIVKVSEETLSLSGTYYLRRSFTYTSAPFFFGQLVRPELTGNPNRF
jgi:hypothetical protein